MSFRRQQSVRHDYRRYEGCSHLTREFTGNSETGTETRSSQYERCSHLAREFIGNSDWLHLFSFLFGPPLPATWNNRKRSDSSYKWSLMLSFTFGKARAVTAPFVYADSYFTNVPIFYFVIEFQLRRTNPLPFIFLRVFSVQTLQTSTIK